MINLSRRATPVDFAYAIHSEVGDHCAGARVNGKMVPLRQILVDGDTVTFQSGAKGLIRNVTDTTFIVDANHKLAGKYLTFEIELVSIR